MKSLGDQEVAWKPPPFILKEARYEVKLLGAYPMSRSYKHTKVFPNTGAESDKYFKTKANRRHRHTIKLILKQNPDVDILPTKNQLSNVWDSQKDGKQYWANATKKDMRK